MAAAAAAGEGEAAPRAVTRALGDMNDSSTTRLAVEVCHGSYTVLQRPTSMNHGMALWDSGLGFCQYLEANPRLLESLRGKRLLEVGAGCALVSMVAARAGAAATATDLPDVVAHAAGCCLANGLPPPTPPAVRAEPGGVAPVVYRWGDDVAPLVSTHGPFDVIVGTDVLYSKALVPVLLHSLVAICRAGAAAGRPSPTIYIANEVRCADTHAAFLALADELFTLKAIPKKRLGATVAASSVNIYELHVRDPPDGRAAGGGGGGGEAV